MKEYGYARVSSKDQNLSRQIKMLKEAGVPEDRIITDKKSGKNFDRTGYQYLVSQLQKGDLLTICSIDRLGRNYDEIKDEWRHLTHEIGADIRVLDMPLLDTRSSADDKLDSNFISDLVLQILSYVAQKERENINKRQSQGIAAMPIVNGKRVSIKTGKPIGRPVAEYPEDWTEVYTDWKNKKITAVKAMDKLDLKKATFYNLVKRYESPSDKAADAKTPKEKVAGE